jgi:hypothetical protein
MGSLRGVESSDERLFVHIVHNDPPGNQIVPLADFSAGPLAAGTPVEMGPGWLPMHLAHAEDTRLTLPYGTGLTVVDASDPNAPTLHEHDLQGYSCQDLMVSDDTAYCALGQWGLQVLSLQ